MPGISKELFIESIEFMRDRSDKQTEIDKLFREEFQDGIFWPYMRYESHMAKILKHIMHDEQNEWIDYFCWERDFGRDTELGDVKEADGTPIPFSTVEDLWNMLIKDNFSKE